MTYQHCTHGGKPCPRVFQAVPMQPVERRPWWPSLVVAGIFLGIAIANGLIPAIAKAL